MKFIIVGVQSLLGAALAKILKQAGHMVIGTGRGCKPAPGVLSFDLSDDTSFWPEWPEDIDSVFIAAAVTSQKVCADFPDLAWRVNVGQTLELIRQFRDCGVHVIFPSTNLVLACDRPKQPVDAPYGPIGFYGKCKAEVEQVCLQDRLITVARLPKILDRETGILKTWTQQIECGVPLKAFTNLMVAPVSLEYAACFLAELMVQRPGDVWQISGDRDVSYEELAQRFVEVIGAKDVMWDLSEMVGDRGALPKYPGMDGALTEERFGIGVQSLGEVFQ